MGTWGPSCLGWRRGGGFCIVTRILKENRGAFGAALCGDLGLQMSGACGVCICCFYLLLEEDDPEGAEGEEKMRNLTPIT